VASKQFRFRPRYRGVALTSIGVGGTLGATLQRTSAAVPVAVRSLSALNTQLGVACKAGLEQTHSCGLQPV